MAKINHPAFPWFAPTQEPKPQSLQLLVDQHLTALNLPPSPLKLIRTDWVTAGAAARAAAWMVVQDLMPERGFNNGNPFLPLMEICEQGFCPIGLVSGEFNISVPPIRKAA